MKYSYFEQPISSYESMNDELTSQAKQASRQMEHLLYGFEEDIIILSK